MRNNDRVILIQGDGSNWYEQAIFIMKASLPKSKMPVDLVAEAEKIINGYHKMHNNQVNTLYDAYAPKQGIKPDVKTANARRRRKAGADKLINAIMLMSCVLLAGLLIYTSVQ